MKTRNWLGLSLAVGLVAGGCGMEDARLASIDVSDTRPSEATALDHGGHVDGGAAPPEVVAASAGPVSNAGAVQPAEQQTVAPAPTGSSATEITVPITSNGFNGQPSGFTVTVKKGVKVRIKFVNEDTTGDNVHIIAFSGVNVPETELSAASPTGTVEFTPSAIGRSGFSCQNQWCTIHPKLKGTLVVVE